MSYQIDKSHSQIQFSVRHMMIAKVRGVFESFDGVVALNEESPANSTVEIRIDAASLNTRDARRDDHLRSGDFFAVDQYPHLTFISKRIDVLDESRALLTGDLTIRNITQEVTLDVEYTGSAKSPWGTISYGFNGHTVIDRKDWNLTWNAALETGGMLVGDDITIDIELEVVKLPETEAVR
jgi:polyisoprenoid-binding protein YceI